MNQRQFLRWLGMGAGGMVWLPTAVRPAEAPAQGQGVNVRTLGAKGDGRQPDTRVLQAAIEACAGKGGGTVYFPAGTYLSGTLFLRSGTTLHLDNGATLLGSRNLADYPVTRPALRSYTDNYTERSLLYGEGLERITLEGRGVIDGQGAAFQGPYKVRPFMLRLVACRDVVVRDLTLRDSPMWVQHYLACDDVRVEGLTVRSRCNHNNDGIDIDGCERVRIANCDIRSGDDAIVLKSTLNRPCKEVLVNHCILSSDCNAFKLGTESNGGFDNIVVSHCALYDTKLAGLALEMVDGGVMDRINISNITMRNVNGPIFIRLGNRARPFQEGQAKPGQGSLRHLRISQVQAEGANRVGCSITGLPERAAEDIVLDNIRVAFAGGGKLQAEKREIPEHPAKYPEYSMFGELPAYGFYCRHVRGLRFRDIQLAVQQDDPRPAMVCEDVEDLDLAGWRTMPQDQANPGFHFKDVRQARIRDWRVEEKKAAPVLRVEGARSAKIRLIGDELGEMKSAVALGAGVPADAVVWER